MSPSLRGVANHLSGISLVGLWITDTNPHVQGKALGSGKFRDDVFSFSLPCLILSLSFFLVACSEQSQDQKVTREVPKSIQEVEFSFSPVVKKFAPTVVNIYATAEKLTKAPMDKFMDDPFYQQYMDRLHGPEENKSLNSMGSGIIISDDGYILTNYHVIEGGDKIKVVLSDRREFEAKVVVAEERTDLVMLKIDVDGEKLPYATLDADDNLQVGDVVLAIGNPFGVGQSVSMGIISAVGRSQSGISDFRSFIQTDASINPGNSGGALVTTDGRMIGMNTAIYSQSGESIGIGFAIPSSMLIPFVTSAIHGNRVERPWMGIRIRGVDSDIAKKIGFTYPYGVLIKDIYKGGAADQAGLQVDDILTKFNGDIIDDDAELDYRISRQNINTKAHFTILRDGKEIELDVDMIPPPHGADENSYEIKGKNPLTGAIVAELSPALSLDLGLDTFKHGILILDLKLHSIASEMKFQIGDVLYAIDGQNVETLESFFKVMDKEKNSWKIEFLRGGEKMTLDVGKK